MLIKLLNKKNKYKIQKSATTLNNLIKNNKNECYK